MVTRRAVKKTRSDAAIPSSNIATRTMQRARPKSAVVTKGRPTKRKRNLPKLSVVERYTAGRTLGSGKNGDVLECIDANGKAWAQKTLSTEPLPTGCAFSNEVEAIEAVRDLPGFLTYVDADETHAVFPLAVSDLFEVLAKHSRRGEQQDEKTVKTILRAVLHSLEALHSLNLVHCDIKPENILLMSEEPNEADVKITDMEWMTRNGTQRQFTGSGGYKAPETMTQHLTSQHVAFTDKYDIFALGATAYAMFALTCPFKTRTANAELSRVRIGPTFKEQAWASYSLEARSFVSDLLKADPASRPTAAEALEHPWLKGHPQECDSVIDCPHNVTSCPKKALVDIGTDDSHDPESVALTVELQCGLISQEEYDTKIAHHRAAVANAECQFDMEV